MQSRAPQPARSRAPVVLADLTTIGLGGPAPSLEVAETAAEVAELVGRADAAHGVLVLGGGSNIVVADRGIEVPVVRIGVLGVRVDLLRGGSHDVVGRGSHDAVRAITPAGTHDAVRGDGGIADTGGLLGSSSGGDLDDALVEVSGALDGRSGGGTAHDDARGGAVAGPGFEAIVTVGAGENWDDVVAELVAGGWTGVEALSGIPGSAGATPVQNVGAYGAEIADVLIDVELYDRRTRTLRRVPARELMLGYRSSVLKGTERGVVTSLRFGVSRAARPIRYAQLAEALGVAAGDSVPPAEVRAAVLGLRRGKGMVIDPCDPDTRSVGSFFTNPVVGAEQLDAVLAAARAWLGPDVAVPQFPAPNLPVPPLRAEPAPAGPAAGDVGRTMPGNPGRTKLSAAWLIERAGFGKGYPGSGARIAISTKHTLALTNRGGGTTAELVHLAREIRDGVKAAFGVTLQPEPVLLGVGLDEPGPHEPESHEPEA